MTGAVLIGRITLAPEPLLGETARALIAELDAELSALYPPEANFFELEEAEVEGAGGVFLVARVDGEPLGCGAVRAIDATSAEIKRMYVRPAGRGKGIGRAILGELERLARAMGVRRMLLETGGTSPKPSFCTSGRGTCACRRSGGTWGRRSACASARIS